MCTGMEALMGASLVSGAASTGLGAYSAQQQAKRKREVYNQYLARTSPEAVAAGTEAIYPPLSGQGQAQVNRYLQAEMASRGVQDGGYGSLIAARGWSELESQRRDQAMRAYLNAVNSGLSGASANVGQPAGGTGAFGNSLQNVALLAMLNRNQTPPVPQLANPPVPTTPPAPETPTFPWEQTQQGPWT